MSLGNAAVDGQLPRVVKDCLAHLSKGTSLAVTGLFRKVPRMADLDVLRATCDRGHPVDLSEWPENVILTASLLKLYLRSLPTPLIPALFYDRVRKCPADSEAAARYIKDVFLPDLAEDHPDGEAVCLMLKTMLRLLASIANRSGALSSQRQAMPVAHNSHMGRCESYGCSQSGDCDRPRSGPVGRCAHRCRIVPRTERRAGKGGQLSVVQQVQAEQVSRWLRREQNIDNAR